MADRNFVDVHLSGGYASDLSGGRSFQRSFVPLGTRRCMGASASVAGKQYYHAMDAYTRHKMLMKNYVLYSGHREDLLPPSSFKTDHDVLEENYKFIRDDPVDSQEMTWEQRLAKRYYDKLFKEYALADMSRYKEGKIGFQWRTKQQVVEGVGQFSCGNKRCKAREDLRSYEVNFGYTEGGARHHALVKLRLCSKCAYRLFYKKVKTMERVLKHRRREAEKAAEKAARKKEAAARKRKKKKKKKEKRSHGSSGSGSGSAKPGADPAAEAAAAAAAAATGASAVTAESVESGVVAGATAHAFIDQMRRQYDALAAAQRAASGSSGSSGKGGSSNSLAGSSGRGGGKRERGGGDRAAAAAARSPRGGGERSTKRVRRNGDDDSGGGGNNPAPKEGGSKSSGTAASAAAPPTQGSNGSASSAWQGQAALKKTHDEEFDEFFADMLM